MKTFSDLKKEIYEIEIKDPKKVSKYSKFLDKLVSENDRRGKNESWDLWYFSDNTEFCRDSARYFLDEVENEFAEYQKFNRSNKQGHPIKGHGFQADRLRSFFGGVCFYLYAALESFAHEINIFYELNEDRRNVTIKCMNKLLTKQGKGHALLKHLENMKSDVSFQTFFKYRDAIMHGYVFPLHLSSRGFFIKENPKNALFSFKNMNINLLEFCRNSYSKVDDFICRGWRCFETDELTPP